MKNIFRDADEIKSVLPTGKKFTLIGGVFDLIHIGHIHLLEYASTLEDLLVVAVLSDGFVRSYKGPMRPVINQRQRAHMVASIRLVDMVYISEVSPNGIHTLRLLRPDSVVFGEEPSNTENIKRWTRRISDHSPSTKINLFSRGDDGEMSTSHILKRIQGEVV